MNDWRVQLTTMELEESDIEATLEALRSGWLTMGPRTAELEQAYASAVGSEHAVAVSSGTAALHLACVVAGVGPGDEVIVPALSFVADAHAPRCAGGEPVLVDVVAPGEPLVDPAAVEAAITERTKAVIAVHMFGYPADLERLAAICDEHGLALIEDCAESDGGRLRDGSPAGTRGVCGCFSFFSKTQLGVGEGGIMTTDDDEFAARLRLLRSHAMTSVTWDRHRGHAETYDVTDLGFNYRIDEPRAALARSRLERLDHSLAELGRVAGEYRERLAAGRRGRDPVRRLRPGLVRALRLPVLVADQTTRDALRERMHANGVQTTFYPSLTQLTLYAEKGPAPVAEEFADRHLALPFSPALDSERIELVVSELADGLRA